MTRHDPKVSMHQMLDYAREAVVMAHGRARSDLDADRQFALAVTHLLELVGEAASRVPPEDQERHPAVPWRQLVGLRNRLIHGYDEVDLDILWAIIAEDIPPLVAILEECLGEREVEQPPTRQ
jgi:uncharacterized protein with HEPN domain